MHENTQLAPAWLCAVASQIIFGCSADVAAPFEAAQTQTTRQSLNGNIVFELEGRVDTVEDPGDLLNGAIVPGTRVTGQYTFHLDAADANPDPSIARYNFDTLPYVFELHAGGLVFGPNPDRPTYSIYIANDDAAGYDEYCVSGNDLGSIYPEGSSPPLGAGQEDLEKEPNGPLVIKLAAFCLADASAAAHDSVALSDQPPALAPFPDRTVLVHGFVPYGRSFNFTGELTSLSRLPQTPDEHVDALIHDVDDALADGSVDLGNATSLGATLDATQSSIDGGNDEAAIAQLEAFIRQVEAFLRSGSLDAATGTELIEAAQAALASLGG